MGATHRTQVGREKFLVLGMVHDLLRYHLGMDKFSVEGEVWGAGSIVLADLRWDTRLQGSALRLGRELGKIYSTARAYSFKGKLHTNTPRAQPLQVNCHVLEDPKHPVALAASVCLPGGPFWYEFDYRKTDDQNVIREIWGDLASPHLARVL